MQPGDPDAVVLEAKVTYTTKELLQRIDDRFDRLEKSSEDNAKAEDVAALEHRVTILETDASGTKAVAKALLETGRDRFSKREKVAGLAIGVLAAAPSIHPIVQFLTR